MLPHLPGVGGANAGGSVQVPPPPTLRLPKHISEAGWSTHELALKASGNTVAQKAGLRYERKILNDLLYIFGSDCYLAPPLYYIDENGFGLAIPDALIIHQRWIICVEVKSQHMPEAWWQLRKKYEPVLRKIYPKDKILLLEICRSLDADTPFPEAYQVVGEIPFWVEDAPDGILGVMQWKL